MIHSFTGPTIGARSMVCKIPPRRTLLLFLFPELICAGSHLDRCKGQNTQYSFRSETYLVPDQLYWSRAGLRFPDRRQLVAQFRSLFVMRSHRKLLLEPAVPVCRMIALAGPSSSPPILTMTCCPCGEAAAPAAAVELGCRKCTGCRYASYTPATFRHQLPSHLQRRRESR